MREENQNERELRKKKRILFILKSDYFNKNLMRYKVFLFII